MNEVLEVMLGVWIILWRLFAGVSRLRKWLTARRWPGAPTHLFVRGRPVFISSALFQRVTEGAYPDQVERASARIGAYMGSRLSSESQQRHWKVIHNWLESRYDADPVSFEAEWVTFQLSGAEAERDLRDLMTAWAELTGNGECVSGHGAIGIADKKSHSVFAGISVSAIVEGGGTLEQFSIRTAKGSELHADLSHMRVIAT